MEKQTPGSILASILKGEGKHTMDDLNKSTENFFKDKGVNVKIDTSKKE